MLAALILLTFTLASPRAQSAPEYSFRLQSTVVGSSLGGATPDDAPQLTMPCLTANGYGQWTISPTGGTATPSLYVPGWYLLANGLYTPSSHYDASDVTDHPRCIPPGVVQCGSMTVSAEAEATANLDGDVEYVWPDRTPGLGTPFIINRFTRSDLDLSLSFLSDPIPTAPPVPGNMNVVNGAIHTPLLAQEIPTATNCPMSGSTHEVVTVGTLADSPPDEFQIASDAHYLYIVWCSKNNICSSAPTSEVWATVVDLTAVPPAAVTGWPQDLGSGLMPTVGCDPRNNRSSPSPAFEVAWLQLSPSPAIMRNTCTGGTLLTSPYALPYSYISPLTHLTTLYNSVSHAHILVSSAPGVGYTVALYAIVNDETGHEALTFYRPANTTAPPAAYVDGALAPPNTSIAPAIPASPVVPNFITAISNPYDFDDRHDGGSTHPDQFHCIYRTAIGPPTSKNPLLIVEGGDNGLSGSSDTRLVLNQSGGTILTDPNSYVAAVNQMGIHVHWMTSDAGGTHFYARDTSRAFDEDIEENTLVTDICTVSDGSATGTNHGGTVGATLHQNLTMAIWSDPNYGANTSDGSGDWGLYQPFFATPVDLDVISPLVGTLDFRYDKTVLNIGSQSELVTTPARLTDMPYFYFQFFGLRQGVVVNGRWDYYGLIEQRVPPPPFAETIVHSPFLNYQASPDDDPHRGNGSHISVCSYQLASMAIMPAQLIVHGGAQFVTDWLTYFNATQTNTLGMPGDIDVRNEPNLFPETTLLTGNPPANGFVSLSGITRLTNSSATFPIDYNAGGCVRGNQPYDASNTDLTYTAKATVMTVGAEPDRLLMLDIPPPVPDTFISINFNYINSDPEGTSEIDFGIMGNNITPYWYGEGVLLPQWTVSVAGGFGDAVEFHSYDPYFTMKMEDISFSDIRGNAILVESEQWPYYYGGYGPITISNNSFGTWASNVGLPNIPNIPAMDGGEDMPIFGIYLKNLNLDGTGSADITSINVDNNIFEATQTSAAIIEVDDDDAISAAIGLENSTANVCASQITDNGWPDGISIIASEIGSTTPFTRSLICSNKISGLTNGFEGNAAIQSESYTGYIKLNTITNNNIGYNSGASDNPKFFLNTITGNNLAILGVGPGADVDLSGVHGTTSGGDDIAAFNIVEGPSSEITAFNDPPFAPNGLLVLSDGSMLSKFDLGKSEEHFIWWNFGHNDLKVTSSASPQTMPLIQSASGLVNIGNVDDNFSENNGIVLDPFLGTPYTGTTNWTSFSTSGEVDAWFIAFSATSGDAFTSEADLDIPTGVTCGSSTGFFAKKGNVLKPLSGDTLPTGCEWIFNSAHAYTDAGQWQMAYDTAMELVMQCPDYFPSVCYAFTYMSDAINNIGNYGQRRANYLAWLESVLYLDTIYPEYWCSCAEAIAQELPSADSTSGLESQAQNIPLSVISWLLHHTTCDSAYLAKLYNTTRYSQYESWLNDTSAYPLDTTLPPLDSIQPGLQELLEKHFLYADVPENYVGILSSVTANPNPTSTGTVISFGISQEADVKIEVFDILGHAVASAGFESLFEPGNKSVPISLAGLPSGTYFARILTAYGEVQSVKLVKE